MAPHSSRKYRRSFLLCGWQCRSAQISKDDYFLDLSTLFDEATCEKYGIKAGDTCLDISKLKKYQDMGLTYYEPCYLTVLVNTKNADNVAKLIEYLEEDGVNE